LAAREKLPRIALGRSSAVPLLEVLLPRSTFLPLSRS
jgi:hypothetical protein